MSFTLLWIQIWTVWIGSSTIHNLSMLQETIIQGRWMNLFIKIWELDLGQFLHFHWEKIWVVSWRHNPIPTLYWGLLLLNCIWDLEIGLGLENKINRFRCTGGTQTGSCHVSYLARPYYFYSVPSKYGFSKYCTVRKIGVWWERGILRSKLLDMLCS